MPQVLDIREHFPLDREDTRDIAAEMGVAHPKSRSGVDRVMATDLLVTIKASPEPALYARAAVTVVDLAGPRKLEKLEIEKRYWHRRGVHWSIVTELDRSDQCAVALSWMWGMEYLPDSSVPGYWEDRIAAFWAEFDKAQGITFEELDSRLVKRGFQAGEMINVLRHLAWNGELIFDLDQEFDILWPTSKFARSDPGARS